METEDVIVIILFISYLVVTCSVVIIDARKFMSKK